MNCINRENYELMKKIREFAISYCTFYETTNGRIGTYPDSLIDRTVACFEKVLYNRLYVQEYCGEKPNTFVENLKMANEILDGTIQEDRIHAMIKQLYRC